MHDLDFSPWNLPTDILEAVGLIATCSAQTEHVVQNGIAGCLGVDVEYGMAITTHMTTPLRDHVLRAAAEIRIDSLDDLDELDELLDEIEEAFKVRNAYIHNSLAMDKATGEVFSVKATARGSVDVELLPVTVDKIKADATRIYVAGLALYQFLQSRDLLAVTPPARPRGHKTSAARKKRRKALLKS